MGQAASESQAGGDNAAVNAQGLPIAPSSGLGSIPPRRGVSPLVILLGLAVGAVLLAVWLNAAEKDATKPVMVASRDVPAGSRIRAQDFEMRLDKDAAGAATLEALGGRARDTVPAGETLLATNVTPPRQQARNDSRVLTIQVATVPLSVTTGDEVWLYLPRGQGGEPAAVLRGVLVASNADKPPRSVAVSLAPGDVRRHLAALASGRVMIAGSDS